MLEEICIKKNQEWTPNKISPTYLSNNLISPLEPYRDTVPKSNILTEGTVSRYIDPTFSAPVRTEASVPRSHQHLRSGLSSSINRVLTPLVLTSFLRNKPHNDEFIPQPNLIKPSTFRKLMQEENHFVQEPVYASHIPRSDMFPRSRAEFDVPGLDKDLVNNYPLSEETNTALNRIMKNRYKVTSCQNDYMNYDLDYAKHAVGVMGHNHKKKKCFSACENPPMHVQKFQSYAQKHKPVPGVWPVWPAGANSIVSSITGKIVEKRDVISLDDERDFTRYKMAEVFDPRRPKNINPKPDAIEDNAVSSFGSSKLVPVNEPMFSNCGRFACVNLPMENSIKDGERSRPVVIKEAWSDLTMPNTTPTYTCCEKCKCNCEIIEEDKEEGKYRHTKYYKSLVDFERIRQQREIVVGIKCKCECDDKTKNKPDIARLSERVEDALQDVEEEILDGEAHVGKTEKEMKVENVDEEIEKTSDCAPEDHETPVKKHVTFSTETEVTQHPESKYKCSGNDSREYKQDYKDGNERNGVLNYPQQAPIHTGAFNLSGRQRYDEAKQPFKGGRSVRNKDACSLNLQLDREEETYGLLQESAKLTNDKIQNYMELMSQKRLQQKLELDKEFPVSKVKLPPTPLWETVDYAGGRVADRLGVAYKTIAYKRYHAMHPEFIPDLRDFRQPLRKSKFLGYHTSVFR